MLNYKTKLSDLGVPHNDHDLFIDICYYVLGVQDLKANEARLQELNNIADRLTAMGHTEAAEKIREQITVSWLALSVCVNVCVCV